MTNIQSIFIYCTKCSKNCFEKFDLDIMTPEQIEIAIQFGKKQKETQKVQLKKILLLMILASRHGQRGSDL